MRRTDRLTMMARMLESPQDESVVRWGREGDSFVVLEACSQLPKEISSSNACAEREVHETYSTETLQA